jgi:hypothetical protein
VKITAQNMLPADNPFPQIVGFRQRNGALGRAGQHLHVTTVRAGNTGQLRGQVTDARHA